MTAKKFTLTTSERIDRLRKDHGRTQKWVVSELAKKGFEMSEPVFSQKKSNDTFTDQELESLTEILPGFTY